ncbi:N-acetylmannosamine-6-phosphate 2-epimerase [Rheinheimera tilapiae]|uniref:Putative N-acetylmannosamine-6-phosphate 2-epimerase n=1 Tax=Rheinheimera tilapiae TaxID=875043 RepID=A0ABV6B8L4_9GAMM
MTFKNAQLEQRLLSTLHQSLIVSCQPVPDSPMDRDDIVLAMAQAAVAGGAKGLRIEGAKRVRLVAQHCQVPIVGIIKRDLTDSEVRITPYLEDVKALAEAGALIIAFDGTDRVRPVSALRLLAAIHQHGCIAMADCADVASGVELAKHGCTFIGSTLSGYLGEHTPSEPDLKLVRDLSAQGLYVIAEGRYNTPELAARAIELGATAVTVGSAVTRIEHITGWFVQSVEHASV